MEVKNYLEDEEYKAIKWQYLDYAERCRCLNQFRPEDQWAFNKRDMLLKRMTEIERNLPIDNSVTMQSQ